MACMNQLQPLFQKDITMQSTAAGQCLGLFFYIDSFSHLCSRRFIFPLISSSLHPVLPLLATTSGQWTFPPTSDSEEEEERGDSRSVDFENTLKLWSLQGQRTGPYLTV